MYSSKNTKNEKIEEETSFKYYTELRFQKEQNICQITISKI